MKSSHLRDELKHVRLVHFALVIVSASMLYLVAAAWSDAPQLYRELLSLSDFLGRLQQEGVPLREIDPEAAARMEDQILRSVQNLTTDGLQWAVDPFRSRKPTLKCVWSSAQTGRNNSLASIVDSVTTDHVRFLLPEQIQGDNIGMTTWVTQQLRSENAKGPFINEFTVGTEAKEGADNRGKVTLAVLSWSSIPLPDNPMPEVFEEHRDFDLIITLRSEMAALAGNWLEQRFPTVARNRDQLGEKTLEAALAWAASQRTKGIETLKPTILGVEIKPNNIGIVGPLIISTILVYVLAYLNHLLAMSKEYAERAEESVGYFSPWLGAVPQRFGLSLAVLTELIIPAVTIFLCLWRLAGWPVVFAGGVGVVAGIVPGGLAVQMGIQLAARRVEVDNVKDSEE